MNKKHLTKLLLAILSVLLLLSGCNKTTGTKPSTQTEDNNQVENYLTKKDGNSAEILIKEINTAQKKLDIAIYSITKEDIANAILNAKKKGIDVKVITDSENSKSKTQKEILDKFKQRGIPIKINTPTGLTHLNFTILDNMEALGGCYNYLEDVTDNNGENLIIMKKPDIVNEYSAGFNAMWNNTNDYENY
jgi:phosphatidylserine/phosphatidylglycerophosphate/cardiolipin synthase-like enzyme